MVRVWIADVTSLLKEEVYQRYYQELPAWRKDKADRYKMQKGKAQSAGAWLLWSRAREKYGLPEEAVYNLSHSGRYALCAFSDKDAVKVGCDVEEVKDYREPVARRFFCPDEYRHIMGEKEDDRADRFYRYWVLKESFMKATRQGMALDICSFEIGWTEDDEPVLAKKPAEYPETYVYKEYAATGVHAKIAVCTTDREIDCELHFQQFS